VKKPLAKNSIKKEDPDDEQNGLADVAEASSAAAVQSKKGRKKAAVKGESFDEPITKNGPTDINDSAEGSVFKAKDHKASTGETTIIPGIKDFDLHFDFEAAVKAGQIEDDFDAYVEKRRVQIGKEPKSKKDTVKAKKPAAAGTRRSARTAT